MRAEAQLLDRVRNRELGEIKKSLPLFVQKEREFKELQDQEALERLQAAHSIKEARGRVPLDDVIEH